MFIHQQRILFKKKKRKKEKVGDRVDDSREKNGLKVNSKETGTK